MSPTYREIDVRLRLLNARQFQRDMHRAGLEMKSAFAPGIAAAERMSRVGRSLRTFGGNMTRHVTVPVGFAAAASAKFAADFHQNMRLVETQAGAARGEVAKMTPEILNMAKRFPQGPQELAKGLYHLESLGFHGRDALHALEVAAKGAAIGQADLESTTSALGAAMFVGTKGTMSMEGTMALLDSTVGQGNMRMADLITALGRGVLPAAKVAGLSIQQVMAALALLSDSGMNASSAAAQFGTSLHYFTAPSDKAAKALAAINMSTYQLAGDLRGPEGMIGALKDLRDHLAGLSDTKKAAILGDIFPASRGKPIITMFSMIERSQMRFNKIQANATKQNFFKRWEQQGREPLNKLRTAWSNVQVAIIHFGDAALPVIVSISEAVSKIATAFSELPAPVQHGIVAFALLAAAIGPVTWALGGMIGGFGRTIGAIGKLIKWERALTKTMIVEGALQKRNALGQLMPIGQGTRFSRMLMSNSKWSGAKMGLWMGAAAAAAIAGWEIGKWLRKHVPAVRAAGDWLGKTFWNAMHPFSQASDSKDKETTTGADAMQRALTKLDAAYKRGNISKKEWRKRRHSIIAGTRGWGGTVSREGRYLVGERGPELIDLPPAARVEPLTPSLASAFAAAEGDGAGGESHYHLYIDGKEVHAAVRRVEKRKVARK